MKELPKRLPTSQQGRKHGLWKQGKVDGTKTLSNEQQHQRQPGDDVTTKMEEKTENGVLSSQAGSVIQRIPKVSTHTK